MNPQTRQVTIFDDITRHYHGGNPESLAASRSVDKSKLRAYVLATVGASGRRGMTTDEVQQKIGLLHQTVSARMTELKALGLIEEAGKRPTRSGRQATAWRVSPVPR